MSALAASASGSTSIPLHNTWTSLNNNSLSRAWGSFHSLQGLPKLVQLKVEHQWEASIAVGYREILNIVLPYWTKPSRHRHLPFFALRFTIAQGLKLLKYQLKAQRIKSKQVPSPCSPTWATITFVPNKRNARDICGVMKKKIRFFTSISHRKDGIKWHIYKETCLFCKVCVMFRASAVFLPDSWCTQEQKPVLVLWS